MTAFEIVLLTIGVIAFVISFFIPEGKGKEASLDEEKLQEIIDEKVNIAKRRIDDLTEENVNYSMEKSERALEKITNEKILAVGDYSDSIMNDLNKTHQEVVFLSDMLDKNKGDLTKLLLETDKISKEASKAANDAYNLAANAEKLSENAMETAKKAETQAMVAEDKMLEARRMLIEGDPEKAKEPTASADVPGTDDMQTSDVQGAEGTQQSAAGDEKENDGNLVSRARKASARKVTRTVSRRKKAVEPAADTVENQEPETAAGKDADYPADEDDDIIDNAQMTLLDMGDLTEERDMSEFKAELEKEAAADRQRTSRRAVRRSKKSTGEERISLRFNDSEDMPENNNERILAMHKMGRSNVAIAKDLGLGIGEVKLVIDLYESML
ncbi:MAG: hypothetical protein J6N47_00955 [Lachnospiraceae bacterium]|nr:hypothetical protein [Lachnospiraceae bacterium]